MIEDDPSKLIDGDWYWVHYANDGWWRNHPYCWNAQDKTFDDTEMGMEGYLDNRLKGTDLQVDRWMHIANPPEDD